MAETQLVRAIAELKEKGLPVGELAQALTEFLKRKRLLKRAPKILRALETYTVEQAGSVVVEATSAHSLSDSAKERVREKAEKLFGGEKKKAKVIFHEDPQLLGGVRLETKNTRYDFSLSRSLLDLRKSLLP